MLSLEPFEGLPDDQKFWQEFFSVPAKEWKLVGYEQDWNNIQYQNMR
jgi:hypothetical protein